MRLLVLVTATTAGDMSKTCASTPRRTDDPHLGDAQSPAAGRGLPEDYLPDALPPCDLIPAGRIRCRRADRIARMTARAP